MCSGHPLLQGVVLLDRDFECRNFFCSKAARPLPLCCAPAQRSQSWKTCPKPLLSMIVGLPKQCNQFAKLDALRMTDARSRLRKRKKRRGHSVPMSSFTSSLQTRRLCSKSKLHLQALMVMPDMPNGPTLSKTTKNLSSASSMRAARESNSSVSVRVSTLSPGRCQSIEIGSTQCAAQTWTKSELPTCE